MTKFTFSVEGNTIHCSDMVQLTIIFIQHIITVCGYA